MFIDTASPLEGDSEWRVTEDERGDKGMVWLGDLSNKGSGGLSRMDDGLRNWCASATPPGTSLLSLGDLVGVDAERPTCPASGTNAFEADIGTEEYSVDTWFSYFH